MAINTLAGVKDSKPTKTYKKPVLETSFGDVLRIEIQENWQNYQLATFLTVLEDCYQLLHLLITYPKTKDAYQKHSTVSINYGDIKSKLAFSLFEDVKAYDAFRLYKKIVDNELRIYDRKDIYAYNFSHNDYFFRVLTLNYNSPGSIDLFGIGKVLEFIRDFVKGLINFFEDRQEKKIKIELLKEELKKVKIENAQRIIGLAKEMGCDNITLNELSDFIESRQDKLIEIISSRQIKDIKIINKDVELEK